MNILFVCKYNRFRSKVAEAYFNKIAKGSKHKAKSAGIIKGRLIEKVRKQVVKKHGIQIKGESRTLDVPLLLWQDVIVIVADDVPPSIFKGSKKFGKKVIVWRIPDCPKPKKEYTDIIIKKIKKRVKAFANSLR